MLTGDMRVVSTPQVMGYRSGRVCMAMTSSSSAHQCVDGAFHLPGARHDRRKRVGHSQPKVVMAVHGKRDRVDFFHVLFQKPIIVAISAGVA